MKNDARVEFAHSIWFLKQGDEEPKNSFEDFQLFPQNRNMIDIGSPDFINEEMRCMDGTYDWYYVLGEPVPFNKASGSYSFYVIPLVTEYDWVAEYDRLLKYFDGSLFTIWLNDDPDNIAKGRVYINKWDSPSNGLSTIDLSYTLTEELHNGSE